MKTSRMNPLETLMLAHESGVSPKLIGDFADECRLLGIEPQIETRESRAYNALEDYIPTAIMLFLAKPFFDGFLKKAGEDSYAALKKALAGLIKKAASVRLMVFASGEGKIDPQYPFSRYVAIYSKSPEGTTLKFLFHTEGDEEYFNASTESLCEMLRSGNLLRPDHRPLGGLYIFYYDKQSKTWAYKQNRLTSRNEKA